MLYPLFIVLIAANIFIGQAAWAEKQSGEFALYFLNVGQGDGQLVNLPNDVQVLIDGGKGARIMNELGKILAPTDHYIDLVVATHPDLDHYGGLIDVLKNYEVGAVITNGQQGVAAAFADFQRVIRERKIPEINLKAGDAIRYAEAVFEVLGPTKADLAGKNTNNAGIVLLLQNGELRALYTADIDNKKEQELLRKYDLAADILKVGHHGSKFSSGAGFLAEVRPKVSVIGVGKNNYGHPTSDALRRLANIGSFVARTDSDGTVKITLDKLNQLQVVSVP